MTAAFTFSTEGTIQKWKEAHNLQVQEFGFESLLPVWVFGVKVYWIDIWWIAGEKVIDVFIFSF